MKREIAQKTLAAALGYSRRLEESIGRVRQQCDENVFMSYRRFVGRVMGYLFTEIIVPIYEEHPELAPDWYKSRPDLDGKRQVMDRSIHQDLCSLIDEVDEGVTEAARVIDQACRADESRRYRRATDEIRAQIIGVKEYLNNVGVKDEPEQSSR